ncbi:MAG: hypothetical protein LBV79_06365 [Candidatus Adiutrix sp.]|jgi:hypothetical protein|nr:hypothetical protein [Candidatus Adiutrix sp.]
MKFFTKSTASATFLAVIAASCVLAAIGLLRPGQKTTTAEADRPALARAVTELNILRDHISDRWASLMKSGWNAYTDDQPLFIDLVEAALLAALEAAPPDDPLQAERLIIAVAQVPGAEAAYMAAFHNFRGSAAQCYSGPMGMIGISTMVRDKTDALVLGSRPPLNALPPETEELPSSDPATLRAAYEALKASLRIYYQLMSDMYNTQLNITAYLSPPSLSSFTPQNEPQMEALRRLPNLTEGESKAIEKIPEIWAEMVYAIKKAGEALEQRQAALANLESQVQAALLAIDELRAQYLKRLAE